RRTDEDQRRALQLEEELRRAQQNSARTAQADLVEQENRRLAARVRDLEELQSAEEASRAQTPQTQAALELRLREKEEQWEKEKRELEARCDELKKLHKELLSRQQAPEKELGARLEKVQEELKQRTAEAGAAEGLKKDKEDLQRRLADATRHVQGLTRERQQLEEQVAKKEQGIKSAEALKELRNRKITEMEEEHGRRVAELAGERDRLQQELQQRPAAESAAAAKRAEEELKLCRRQADRGLALAADYQRAVEVLLAKDAASRRGAPVPQPPSQA
ncbi:unnamed protein product, partial [Prorocentrum cordatum]